MDIKAPVRKYIVEEILLGVRGQDLRDEESFLDSGLLDSTGVLSLVLFLEETFAITIPIEETIPTNLDSLDRIEAYMTQKLGVEQVAADG